MLTVRAWLSRTEVFSAPVGRCFTIVVDVGAANRPAPRDSASPTAVVIIRTFMILSHGWLAS